MGSVDPKHVELIHALADHAWSLSEAELLDIRPGAAGFQDAIAALSVPPPPDRPLTPKSEYEALNPHVQLLTLMRRPEFFPFACRTLFNKPDNSGPLKILPFQHVALTELWWRQYPMLVASRGAGKSFLLALYALLRAAFTPGAKIIITAAAFRQAKAVFEYIERFWYNSPVFQSLVNSGPRGGRKRDNGPRRDIDRVEFILGDSVIIGLPLGDGQKIRGLRANYILTDEVASIKEEVYAVVVQGFASVTADPVGNVEDMARMRLLKRLGLWTADMDAEEAKRVRGNQSVLSGTAYYSFNHFCKYWTEYRRIIATRGDPAELGKLVGEQAAAEFPWQQFSVIRLPYRLIPHGYMDASTIARAKQITNSGQFSMEYEACYLLDSDGFFKRSLIERCVVGSERCDPWPEFPSCGRVQFWAALEGRPDCRYVFGVDPASESDHFAVQVVELWPDHRRLVYAWTTRKDDHVRRLKSGRTDEHDFYRFAARKLRDLMKAFPPALVMIDAGGGGVSLREALGDPDKLLPGELPLYEELDPEGKKKKPTDEMDGLHLIRLVHFRDQAWVVEANEGLKKDLEDRQLLFPEIDSAVLGLAQAADEAAGRAEANDDGETVRPTADNLERAMLDVEETKNEMATIVVTETATGNRRWDTPDVKTPGSPRGRMRKDRYSALLLANMGARGIMRAPPEPERNPALGGFAKDFSGRFVGKQAPKELYQGPAWFRRKWKETGGYLGGAVARR